MRIPAAINAAIVTGRPTGKNHSLPVAIRSIKNRAARIVSNWRMTIIKGLFVCKQIKSQDYPCC